MKYFLNLKTGKLHIEGYCYHSKCHPTGIAYFDTEEEAYSYAGRHIMPCKLCQSKKEDVLEEKNNG